MASSTSSVNFDWDKDVSLALQDLEGYAKPEILDYIKGVVGAEESQACSVLDAFGPSPQPPFEDVPTPFKSPSTVESPSADTNSLNSYTLARDLGRLSLLDKEMDLLSPTALCSQLPMCRKIMLKSDILQGNSGTGRTRSKHKIKTKPSPRRSIPDIEEGEKHVDKIEKAYGTLVGRINTKKAAEFRRGRKLHQDPHAGGVRQFEASVSNPLYKKYQPEGYVQTEDEVVVEFIRKLTSDFNKWISNFDGELKQVDPELMVRLLRWDFELPFNIK